MSPDASGSINACCEKPGCSDLGVKIYRGSNGNSVKVCKRHYWKLVTGNSVPKVDTGIRTDIHVGGRRRKETQATRDELFPFFDTNLGIGGDRVEERDLNE